MNFSKNELFCSCFYVITGIVFYLLIKENVLVCDDLNYYINHKTGTKINSIVAAIESQSYDWFHVNGRFIIHVIIQCFCGFIGRDFFWVCDSVVFCFFVLGCQKYCQLKVSNDINPSLFFLLCLIMFSPSWNFSYLGNISASVNYLWAGTAYIWFIVWYEDSADDNNNSIWKSFAIFCASFIIGTLQESFCIGIAGYLVINFFMHRKELSRKRIIQSVGFCLGACVCVLAPANFVRVNADASSNSLIFGIISRFFSLTTNAYGLVILILTTIVLFCFKKYRMNIRQLLSTHGILIISSLTNSAFVVLVAFTGAHQLTSINLYSLIAFVCITYSLFLLKRPTTELVIRLVSCILLLSLAIPIWTQRKNIAKANEEYIISAKISNNGFAVASKYWEELTKKRNWIRLNFVKVQESLDNTVWLSRFVTDGRDDNFITAVLPEPVEDIIKMCNTNNEVSSNIYKTTGNFYVIKVPKENQCCINIIQSVSFFGAVRNRMISGSPYSISTKELTNIPHFINNEFAYYVLIDDVNFKIQKISLLQ